MSLPLTEWRALHRIDKAMHRSDPQLAAALAIFSRLTAGEVMPTHERTCRPDSWPRACLLLVMVTVLRLLTWVAVTSRRMLAYVAQWRGGHPAGASADGQPGHLRS
jgi:hypothetical protein